MVGGAGGENMGEDREAGTQVLFEISPDGLGLLAESGAW